jgi:geranylgeranyl transferase type-2 subunit alpha
MVAPTANMHDVKIGSLQALTDVEREAVKVRIVAFRELYAQCFAQRDTNDVSRATLPVQEKLLVQNPECFTVWSHRRRVYEALWAEEVAAIAAAREQAAKEEAGSDEHTGTAGLPSTDATTQAPQKLVDLMTEVKFNTKIVTQHYKCYAAWNHRRWILAHMSPALRLKILTEENRQLEELMRADERNFHAWGYRRWVVSQLDELGAYPPSRDLAFAETKINQNFSNYSAWHCRGLVIGRMVKELNTTTHPNAEKEAELRDLLRSDAQMVVRALYCDPADQSAWMYVPALMSTHRALVEVRRDASVDWAAELRSCAEQLLTAAYELAEDELATDDRSVKWPLWLVVLFANDGHVNLQERPLRLRSSAEEYPITTVVGGWERLSKIDPLRHGYYRDMALRAASVRS